MNARDIRKMAASLERHKAKIAKEREELRELIADAEAIEGTATEAVDYLQYAIDALSQYV